MRSPTVQKELTESDSDPGVLRSGLAEARSQLLRQLVGLSTGALHGQELEPGTTPVTALARIAGQDDDAACALEMLLGREGRAASISMSDITIEETLPTLLAARSRLLSAAAGLVTAGNTKYPSQVTSLLQDCRNNDRRWARRLEWWKEKQQIQPEPGPWPILLASLKAARKELLTAYALLPPENRTPWQETLATLAAQEEIVLQRPDVHTVSATSRNDVWRRFHDTHHALVTRLNLIGDTRRDTDFYAAVTRAIDRDREAAFAVRATLPRAAPAEPALPAVRIEQSGPEKTSGPPR